MMNKQFLKRILAVVALAMLAACPQFTSSEVNIVNSSDRDIDEITVTAAGETIWEGKLRRGELIEVHFSAMHDGALALSGIMNGEKIGGRPVAYVTPNSGVHHIIEIRGNGEIVHELAVQKGEQSP